MCIEICVHSASGDVTWCEVVRDLWAAFGVDGVYFEDEGLFDSATGGECLCTVDVARTAKANNCRISSLDADGTEDPFNIHLYEGQYAVTEPCPLREWTTADLVNELKDRDGVEGLGVAPYAEVRLKIDERDFDNEGDEHIYRRHGPMVMLLVPE